MKSLLIVIKEEFLAKGIALALMDDFQSIHTTKNPYDAINIVKEEKVNVVITELGFETLDCNSYLEKLTRVASKGITVIIIKDGEILLKELSSNINIVIQQKPISIPNVKKIIKSLKENTIQLNTGEK